MANGGARPAQPPAGTPPGVRWKNAPDSLQWVVRLVNISNIMKRPLTVREEANALTCCAFRNGYLEELHAGKNSELLAQPGLSRITDTEMKKLMIQASTKMAELLAMKASNPKEYWRQMKFFSDGYCAKWEK